MRKLAATVLTLVAALLAVSNSPVKAADGGVKQVFLVQNSGWMEPFYLDANSPLKPFVTSLIGKANLSGVPVVIASFNQDGQVANRRSPEVLYEGPFDASRVAAAVERIDLPRKASGAYADADFRGALAGTFRRIMGGHQGVIWIVTNNKDAPDNRPGVVENTRAFYGALRNSPYITAIAAFPMRKLVTGPHFSERGLIFYALAYGEDGRRALDALLRDGAPLRSLFPSPPVKLKPLATDPVELRLSSPSPDVSARVVQGRLIVSHVPGGAAFTLRLRGDLHNTYYPQNIAHASLDASWRPTSPELRGATVTLTPRELSRVPADGESGPVDLAIHLPAVRRSPGLAGYFEDERTVVGEVELRLDDLSFSLDPAFIGRMSAVSGGDGLRADQAEAVMTSRLPEVFLDYRRISSASMRVPVQITFRFSPWPLIALVATAAAALLMLLALVVNMLRSRTYVVRVGDTDMTMTLRPRERRIVSDAYGARSEVSGRLFGAPFVKPVGER